MAGMTTLDPSDPTQVGPYQLVGRLGAGGMGRVYLGRSKGGRLVAVKVVRQDLVDEPGFRERFAREVDAARLVNALYTAGVVDAAGADDENAWMATAYVPGVTLAEGVAEHGRLPAPAVAALGAGLAEALSAIHAAGVFHRDLKPSNVLLATDGPRVIDFGISVVTDASALTDTGALIGTPGFMSPEQLTGRPFGPESDVFSLAAVLAYAATGQSPFGTGPAHSLMYRIVHEQPDLTGVPEPLRGLLARCLDKDPAQRPTVAGVLEELTTPSPIAAVDPRLAFGAGWLPADLAETIRLRSVPVPHPRQAAPGPTSLPPQPGFPPYGRPPLAGGPNPSAPPGSRASAPAAVTAGVLALLAAVMFVWFALWNVGYANGPTGHWSALEWQNVVGAVVSAGLLVLAAGFTLARRPAGAWTLCALCSFYVVSVFVLPVLQGTALSTQLTFVLGFHKTNGVALGLAVVFSVLTAVAAATAGAVRSSGPTAHASAR